MKKQTWHRSIQRNYRHNEGIYEDLIASSAKLVFQRLAGESKKYLCKYKIPQLYE
ncbi:Bgt-20573 [Blumeria graminis f. sp. tritici]|uniref:Bgt-20573 n=2 Tax=Blumeria graminis f. sp. tritici TaxID=62690 RepID=A0A381LK55_BLUGR|nr:Bgt-20573 [Blumeria graminis f. sp. tritici]